MSDLDNLINKMKGNKEAEEKKDAPVEDEFEDSGEGLEDVEVETPQETEGLKETPKETPQETPKDDPAQDVEHEVALLQNPAIYRRERLVVAKEQNEILKVIAHTLLDLKKMVGGNGKK